MPVPAAAERSLEALRRRRSWVPHIAVAACLLAQFVSLVVHARTLYFWGDDFDFLLHRSLGSDAVSSLMRSHNGHWSTLPVIAFRVLFHIYGLGHYLPYAMMPIAAQLVIGVLFYLLMRQVIERPWIAALSTIATILLSGGAGAQNPLWDFQIGFLGSPMFGLLGMVLLRRSGRRWHILGVLALVLSLFCSGIGILMTVWAALDRLLASGLRSAVRVAIVPAVVQVVWEIGWGHGSSGPRGPLPVHRYDLPQIVLSGLVHVWDTALVTGAGAAALLGLVVVVLFGRSQRPLFALACSGLVVLIGAYTMFGVSRAGFGPQQAISPSRYVYFGVLFCGPAIGCVLDLAERHLSRVWPVRFLAGLAFGLGALVLGLAQLSQWAASRHVDDDHVKPQLVAAVRLADSGAPLLTDTPLPNVSLYIRMAPLLKAQHTLPHVAPSKTDRLAVSAALQTAVSAAPLATGGTSGISWTGMRDWSRLTGCVSHTLPAAGGTLYLQSPKGGAQAAITTQGGTIGTRLLVGTESSQPLFKVVPSGVSYVGVSRPHTVLRATLPGGPTQVCWVRAHTGPVG